MEMEKTAVKQTKIKKVTPQVRTQLYMQTSLVQCSQILMSQPQLKLF